jgi:serine carboxypeptidase-like clade 2
VGNAVTDNYYDNVGTVTYWWTHAMISDRTYKAILKLCDFTSANVSSACNRAMSYAMNHEFGDIDQYSIYTPSCHTSSDTSSSNSTAATTRHRPVLRFKDTLIRRRSNSYDPCTESYAERYYNRLDVQKAMHANTTRIPYKWTACRFRFDKLSSTFLSYGWASMINKHGFCAELTVMCSSRHGKTLNYRCCRHTGC